MQQRDGQMTLCVACAMHACYVRHRLHPARASLWPGFTAAFRQVHRANLRAGVKFPSCGCDQLDLSADFPGVNSRKLPMCSPCSLRPLSAIAQLGPTTVQTVEAAKRPGIWAMRFAEIR